MKVKILELTNERISFIVEGSNPAFVNALRRIMISEVPTMAIDEIVFLENTSVLYDEILAHRLALIPLRTDPTLLELARKEEDLSKYQTRLILDIEAIDGPLIVYSGDLKSEDPRIKPVSDNIPIAKLIKGQKIVLEAYARLGRGKEHAKWTPVSACSYKYFPIVKINRERCNGCGDCVKYCPRHVLELKNGEVLVKNLLACTICRYCEKVCNNEAIYVKGDDTKFIFYVESTGALDPADIVVESSQILKSKAEEFINQLKSLLSASKEVTST